VLCVCEGGRGGGGAQQPAGPPAHPPNPPTDRAANRRTAPYRRERGYFDDSGNYLEYARGDGTGLEGDSWLDTVDVRSALFIKGGQGRDKRAGHLHQKRAGEALQALQGGASP
jgi:hypothetical protein